MKLTSNRTWTLIKLQKWKATLWRELLQLTGAPSGTLSWRGPELQPPPLSPRCTEKRAFLLPTWRGRQTATFDPSVYDPISDKWSQERTVQPVSFQWYHPMLGRPVQKLLLQFLVPLFLPHPEGHVHAAPTGLLYRTSEETRQFLLIILMFCHDNYHCGGSK